MSLSEDCPIDYKPDRSYTLEEFLKFNEWLETHEYIFEGIPISLFERESDGRLVPMPQVPIERESTVAEIAYQLKNWNDETEQHGIITTSQGGFKFSNGAIKAPDVAFTPSDVCCGLDVQQRRTFQGATFSPTFAVEVDDLLTTTKLDTQTSKFEETYFPNGVRLGWLIDPINKIIYTFSRESDGVVRRRQRQWLGSDGKPGVLTGGEVLPGFTLSLEKIDLLWQV